MKKISAADKIYQAAKSLFYESGYYGTTTRDITPNITALPQAVPLA